MIISKDIKFDCAHMLSYYEGKCSNLHGHTYHGTVTLSGLPNPDTGMLVDYNRIKEIADMFDHAMVFSSVAFRNKAEDQLLDWVRQNTMHHVILNGKSTAEGIAEYLVDIFMNEPGVEKVNIRLSETDGSWVEASR